MGPLGPFVFPSSFLQSLDDLFPMQPAVFDENLSSMPTAGDYAREMNSWHVALQRPGIEFWFAAFRIELHPQALNEGVVRMIAGQRENLPCRQSFFAGSVLDHDFAGRDLFDPGLKQGFHLARLDSILDVRAYPILDARAQILVAMHQCHPRTVPIEVKRGLRRGILSTDHHHILIPESMRLRVIM